MLFRSLRYGLALSGEENDVDLPSYGEKYGFHFHQASGIHTARPAFGGHPTFIATGSEAGAQLTYVYPDDPQHKMLYRPWRRIADASILKELRLIFADDGEDTTLRNGLLGIKTIGTRGQFRFAELLDAGMQNTFILEQATSKTRLISPSYRSVLTFTKASMLDPAEQRHTVPDAITTINASLLNLGDAHKSDVGGSPVRSEEHTSELQSPI